MLLKKESQALPFEEEKDILGSSGHSHIGRKGENEEANSLWED